MNTLSSQEIFDKVATHLLTQGKRALLPSGDCAYRGQDGSKCAIGCLIPDDLYEGTFKQYEGKVWCVIPDDELLKIGIEKDKNYRLLTQLQSVHDNLYEDPAFWKQDLRKLAEGFVLGMTALDAFPDPQAPAPVKEQPQP